MSFEALKSEVLALKSEERRRLLAMIVALNDTERPDYGAKHSQKIDDPSPDRWRTVEQCERELGLPGDSR